MLCQTYIDRFGAKTFGAALAQSKMKEIEKIRRRIGDAPPPTGDGKTPHLFLPKAVRGEKLLVEITNGNMGYLASAIDLRSVADSDTEEDEEVEKVILKDCNVKIERGMRISVRGKNGEGKR